MIAVAHAVAIGEKWVPVIHIVAMERSDCCCACSSYWREVSSCYTYSSFGEKWVPVTHIVAIGEK